MPYGKCNQKMWHLVLQVDSAAAVVFDEGELGNHLISDYKIQYDVPSGPHKKDLAVSKPERS